MGKDWRNEAKRNIYMTCKHCGEPCQCRECLKPVAVVAAVMCEDGVEMTIKCGCGETLMTMQEFEREQEAAGVRHSMLGVH